MKTIALWALWVLGGLFGTVALLVIASNVRRPEPVPCTCLHCTTPMPLSEALHFELWTEEMAA